MAKGRKAPEKPQDEPMTLQVVGPWVCSSGANLQHNAFRLIKVGWRYWSAIAARGYAIDGPGVVAIKIDRAKPPLPADARIFEAAWTPLSIIPKQAQMDIPELIKNIDPSTGIVFVFGYESERQSFYTTETADTPHDHYLETLERSGLIDSVGIVAALDLIEEVAPASNITPSA